MAVSMRVALDAAVVAFWVVPEEPVVVAAIVVRATEDVFAEATEDVVTVIFRELKVVVVLFVPVVVPLLTNVNRGVKLYPSGPTFETFEAGPTMISIA
jgi:hypothetical protein